MRSIRKITFFGSSKGEAGDPNYDSAQVTAREIARLGITIIDGGGPGVMQAATLGAKEVNGKTEVVYYKPKQATDFDGESVRNLADKQYKEENYIERTRKLLELGDAYMIFNGGTGTISEFGMAWGLARLYFGHHKPLILYGYFWHYIIGEFKRRMRIRDEELEVLTIVTNTQEAIKAIHKYDELLEKNRHDHRNCHDSECRLFL
ncbi:MAG TPA: LOG family protein [Patescibacteria group bacterium]